MIAPWRRYARELADGLTGPSLLSVSVAVVTCALALFVALPRLAVSSWNTVLKADSHDYYLITTARLRSLTPTAAPIVVLFGASSLRMAVGPDEYLETLLAADGRSRVPIRNLSVSAARSWDLAAMVDAIPAGFRGVLLIALTPKTISYPSDTLRTVVHEPRLGLVSSTVDADAVANGIAPPWRSGVNFIDNYWFYASRADALLANLMVPLGVERAKKKKPVLHKVREEYAEGYREQVRANYASRSPANLAVIAHAIDALRRRSQVEIVIAESPLSKNLVREMGEPLYREHLARVASFAREIDALFIDFNKLVRQGDILDYAHISNDDARVRCSESLVGVLRYELDKLR